MKSATKMEGRTVDHLETVIHDVKECKYSLEMLMNILGAEMMNLDENKADWQTIFNNLRIASTNLISISKSIKDKKEMLLKTSVVLPINFSEDVDLELQEMTNHRISVFNQDVIPHILRTKLIPALEEEENAFNTAGKEFEQTKTFDKSINFFKKTIDDCANLVEKPKRELDTKQNLSTTTYNLQETYQLVSLVQNTRGGRQPQIPR